MNEEIKHHLRLAKLELEVLYDRVLNKELNPQHEARISKLKLDILLIFYNFSDEYGTVDIKSAAICAKQKLGVEIPINPFRLTQEHYNFMMDGGAIPDTRDIMLKLTSSTGW